MAYNKADIQRRMDGSVENLGKEFGGLRTGRASTSLLDPVMVDVYGTKMPLNQVATVSIPESRMLSVQVWDQTNAKAVEKAIMDAGLGLNPQTEGAILRLPLPDLTEDRRTELTKVAGKYAEASRIAIRNVRRDAMDDIKKSDESDDVQKRLSDEVQKMTDETIKKVDAALVSKEKDIMTV